MPLWLWIDHLEIVKAVLGDEDDDDEDQADEDLPRPEDWRP